MLTDVLAGTGGSDPKDFTSFKGLVYFSAADGSKRYLYKYDGKTATQVPGGYDGPISPVVFGDALYFSANGGSAGQELYKYTGSGAPSLIDINTVAGGSNPAGLKAYNNALYFFATSPANGTRDLYQYTGGTPTAVTSGTQPQGPLVVFNGKLYFTATTAANGRELYQYDGTTVSLAADVFPGTAGSSPVGLAVSNGSPYFSAAALGPKPGTVALDFTGALDSVGASVVQPDGKVIVVGSRSDSAVSPGLIARYNLDGTP